MKKDEVLHQEGALVAATLANIDRMAQREFETVASQQRHLVADYARLQSGIAQLTNLTVGTEEFPANFVGEYDEKEWEKKSGRWDKGQAVAQRNWWSGGRTVFAHEGIQKPWTSGRENDSPYGDAVFRAGINHFRVEIFPKKSVSCKHPRDRLFFNVWFWREKNKMKNTKIQWRKTLPRPVQ